MMLMAMECLSILNESSKQKKAKIVPEIQLGEEEQGMEQGILLATQEDPTDALLSSSSSSNGREFQLVVLNPNPDEIIVLTRTTIMSPQNKACQMISVACMRSILIRETMI
jgi:hypothetical protein